MQPKATRREFLKTGGKFAGTVLLSSLSGGCMRASGNSETNSAQKAVLPVTRDDYTVFSTGKIGTMTVKNRLVRSATMVAAANGGRPTDVHGQRGDRPPGYPRLRNQGPACYHGQT